VSLVLQRCPACDRGELIGEIEPRHRPIGWPGGVQVDAVLDVLHVKCSTGNIHMLTNPQTARRLAAMHYDDPRDYVLDEVTDDTPHRWLALIGLCVAAASGGLVGFTVGWLLRGWST